jgi:hypothetical protein
MAINLPESVRPKLLKLASMDGAKFEQVVAVLQRLAPIIDADDAEALGREAGLEQPTDFALMTEAALNLAGGKVATQLDLPTFVQEALRALRESREAEGVEIPEAQLGDRLARLLSIESVAISAKALSILYDYERHVSDFRILTDIRPIFADDVITQPLAALITHALKIQYHETDKLHDFYISLDSADLRDLQSHIERALAKELALQATLEAAHVRGIHPL